MIHHYINLVSWREMLTLYKSNRDIVLIDSISLLILTHRFRKDTIFQPGTSVLKLIRRDLENEGEWYFLTAKYLPALASHIQYELPMFEEVAISKDLTVQLQKLASQTKVAIGISSPKQNQLAALLYALRPDLEYHCLGAAIADLGMDAQSQRSRLSGTGFEWLGFLFVSPRRTYLKLVTTLKEMFSVFVNKASKRAFKKFVFIIATNQKND